MVCPRFILICNARNHWLIDVNIISNNLGITLHPLWNMGSMCYLSDDDGWEVFEALDVRQEWVAQGSVGLWWELIERCLDLHLHCLGGKVTGLHILLQLKELVWYLPCVHLEGDKRHTRQTDRGPVKPGLHKITRLSQVSPVLFTLRYVTHMETQDQTQPDSVIQKQLPQFILFFLT